MILETLASLRHLPRLVTELRATAWPGRHPSESGNWWGTSPSATGLDVNPWSALSNTPLYAGINLIAGTLSCLTFLVDTRRPDGKFDRDEEHWLAKLLHEEPNPEMTAETFTYAQYINKLIYGDQYAEIERNGEGQPRHLWHLGSWRVTPKRVFKRLGGGLTEQAAESTPEDRRRGGELLYEVKDGQGASVWLTRFEMFHVPGFTLTGVRGNSLVSMHKETVAVGLALTTSAAAIFGNASAPMVAIERPAEATGLDPDGVRARLAAWEASLRGVFRRGRAVVMQEGEQAKVLDLKLHELQFVENLKHNVPEVARVLNIDAFWLGHDGSNNTYANVELRWTDLQRRTLLPHLKAAKAEIWRKLVPITEAMDLRVRYNVKELLEPDAQMRSLIQQRYLGMGVETTDSIARQEGHPGIPDEEGGNARWIANNLRPMDQALHPPAPPKGLPPAGGGDAGDEGARAARLREAAQGLFEAALQRVVRREAREIRRAVQDAGPAGLDALLGRVDTLYERELPEFAAELAAPALGAAAAPFAKRYAVAHRAELRARLGDASAEGVIELLDGWMQTAARTEAAREIERLTEGA